MRVEDLMTALPHGMQANESVRHAADLMAKHNIGAILVYDGAKLTGIVTDRDLTIRSTAVGGTPGEPVREVMTENPITIAPSASADEALQVMVERGIGRLCVVEGDVVKGIVSFGDLSALMRLIAEGLSRRPGAAIGRSRA